MELSESAIARFFYRLLRLPLPQQQSNTAMAKTVSRILVFGKFPNPTFDYYFAARLMAPGMPEFELVDIRHVTQRLDADRAFIIIVRYTSFALSRWIARNRAKLAGVAVFVDDDIVAAITSPEANLGYRFRLITQSILPLRLLNRLIDELWVSTATLQQRLSYANPRLLPPAPAKDTFRFTSPSRNPLAGSEKITVAYHATAIHSEEHRFLRPIVSAVLEARQAVYFEVVASGNIAKEWQRLHRERVIVKAPLPWCDYQGSQTEQIDIMLVPVAPSKLNDCRAETKRIDIARVCAAGLLSDCPAFSPAQDGEILLPYDQAVWISYLLALVDDSSARRRAADATLCRVEEMYRRASKGIPLINQAEALTDLLS